MLYIVKTLNDSKDNIKTYYYTITLLLLLLIFIKYIYVPEIQSW